MSSDLPHSHETAAPSRPAEQPASTTAATHATGDRGSTTVTAVAEPASRPAITTGEPTTAVADQPTIAALASTAEAGTFIPGVGVAVTQQDARVRVIGGAVTDEEPKDASWLPSRHFRHRLRGHDRGALRFHRSGNARRHRCCRRHRTRAAAEPTGTHRQRVRHQLGIRDADFLRGLEPPSNGATAGMV